MAFTKTSNSPDCQADAPCYKVTADGAITIKNGVVMITKATAAALTLALPTTGDDDGKILEIVDTIGAAHTVTTPINGINAASHIATFGGTIGQACRLQAYAGSWWNKGTGIALS